jgi:hypothetical protein
LLNGKLDSSLTSYWKLLSETDSGEGTITEKGKKRKRNTRQSEDVKDFDRDNRDNRDKDHPGRNTLNSASSTASSKVSPFLDSISDTVSGVSLENYCFTADELPSSLVHFATLFFVVFLHGINGCVLFV